MAKGYLPKVLLLLGFLLGQWAAVVHAAQHEVLEPHGTQCQVCSIAHASPVSLDLPRLPVLTCRHEPVRADGRVFRFDIRIWARPHSRGPPATTA
jgi:hypothetical protein